MNNLPSALAYIGPLFLYTLLKKPQDEVTLWHAKNGAGLFVSEILLYLIVVALSWVVPDLLLGLTTLLAQLVWLVALLASLYGAYTAWKGQKWIIPFASNLGQKMPFGKTTAAAAPAPAPMPAPAPAPMPAPAPAPMPAPAPEPTPPTPPQNPTV